jgi:hypothetical protein
LENEKLKNPRVEHYNEDSHSSEGDQKSEDSHSFEGEQKLKTNV